MAFPLNAFPLVDLTGKMIVPSPNPEVGCADLCFSLSAPQARGPSWAQARAHSVLRQHSPSHQGQERQGLRPKEPSAQAGCSLPLTTQPGE